MVASMSLKYHSKLLTILLMVVTNALVAETRVQLTEDLPKLDIIYNNSVVTIQREQNPEHILNGTFAMTSRPCPPACISPIEPVAGINVIGELELFKFLEDEYLNESGLLIDARSADWFKRGTIPGSINLPFNRFDANNASDETENLLALIDANERYDVGRVTRFLEKRGFMEGDKKTDKYDFTFAKKLIVWDNGPWSDSAAKVIAAFVETGYPAEYIHYYHGGMQSWQTLGLTIVKP